MKQTKYVPLKKLAGLLGVKDRTIRNYCETGLIPEAKKKRNGSYWQIPQKLSPQTRWRLMRASGKLKRDMAKLFRGKIGEAVGLEEDFYELLAFSDLVDADSFEESLEIAAKRISAVEGAMEDSGITSLSDEELEDWRLLLRVRKAARAHCDAAKSVAAEQAIHAAVRRILRDKQRVSAESVAKQLGIHKSTLYRHHGAQSIRRLITRSARVAAIQ